MFDKIRSYFKKKPPPQSENIQNIQLVQDEIVQKIANSYRARRGFDGEKFDGGMNYDSGHGLNLYMMRQRSIKAYHESMQGRAIIGRLRDTVINTGLSLESTPESSIIGLSQEERKEASNIIESRFNLWSNSKQCDFSRENNLGQMERIEFNNQLVKGDYFAALPFSKDPTLLNPLQVKIIKPEMVSTPFNSKQINDIKERGNYIVDGVEFDESDEEVAVFIKKRNPAVFQGEALTGYGSHVLSPYVSNPYTFNNEWVRFPKYGPVSGRQILIHGKIQDFGYEHRGIPLLANVAHELEKITDYSLLELMSAVANATIAATVIPGENAPATNPMPGNAFVPPNLVQTAEGFEPTTAAKGLDNGYSNIGKTVLKNTGGLLISSLNAGEKLESYDTKRPNVNFNEFVDSITKYLAASLSMPIEILHMKFGQNFSASRASLKLYWQSLQVWRDEFISDFLTPVYNSWLLGEVGTGNLILRGFDNPMMRAAWQSAKWIGIPSPSIDPVKEEKAAQIRNKEGYTTREQEAQKRHGASFDSNVERLISENKRLAEANEPLNQVKEAA